jgi:S-formylglutathione hydrolase FrmB
MKKAVFIVGLWLLIARANYSTAQSANQGNLIADSLISNVLKDNKIHLDPVRKIYIYLPASYATSKRAYPVVFYFHTMFTNASTLLEASGMKQLLDRAFSSGLSQEFILVVPDCSSPTIGSLYENSSTSGRWLDYITEELLPYTDSHYRTIPQKESRAVTGDLMGGRGAFKLAMTRPDLFSVVYALHPIATGMGNVPWVSSDINWEKIHQAKTYQDLAGLGFSKIFLGIQQAFLPNSARPPFYCDFMVEIENGERKINTTNMKKVKDSFLLDHSLEIYKDNLSRLRAIAFDWGRFDPVQEHVVSAANLSRQLQDLGIRHEAEEYAGTPWQSNWTGTGRFYTRVIPFLARYLEFTPK